MVAAACAVPWPVSTAIAIHARGMVAGGERIDAVEVVALHPILQFARLVAGVGANFKHGYHDDLDLNRTRFCQTCRS